ncbi:ATP-binding cassette domain-containing protein [Streptomyces vietnamensis]|uniref:ATP-binding cassette domain-containing protein n=1 Tax=Streptomyces vietnamensis TaxID=362257 RepID=UPI0037AE160F
MPPGPAVPPVLHVEAVAVVREGKPLLSDITLTVRPGERWALLGADGAGKTSLLGLLGAQTHPARGRVEVLGRRPGRVDLRELRTTIGHVTPRHPLRSALAVRDVVLTGAVGSVERPPRWAPTPAQEARADRLIATLGLAGRQAARWPTLSQGERGRPLAQGPVDEVLTGELLGACFGPPLAVERYDGRFVVRSPRRTGRTPVRA